MEHTNAILAIPVLGFSLHVDFVQPAEAVEVVDVGAAQERANRRVDVRQLDTQFQRLGLVDVYIHLRDTRAKQRAGAGYLRALGCRRDEFLRLLGQVLGRIAAEILQHHRKPGARAETGDCRRPESESNALGNTRRKIVVEASNNILRVIAEVGSLVPVPELQENESRIGLGRPGQHAVTADGGIAFNRIEFRDDVFDVGHNGLGPLQRCGVRELQCRKDVTLVLFGHEAAGHRAEQQHQADNEDRNQYAGTQQLVREVTREDHELRRCPLEALVEGAEKAIEGAGRFAGWFEQRRGQGRTQRQRVDRRNRHRYGNRDCELLIEASGDSAHRRDRHEDRDQRQ